MARDWQDLFIVDGAPAPGREPAPERRGAARRACSAGCARTCARPARRSPSEIQATLFEDLNDETWERLEEALIYADVGARTTAEVVEQARARGHGRRDLGRRGADRAPRPSCSPTSRAPAMTASTCTAKPTVILVAGVNGTGKTTTVGKLAWHLQQRARAAPSCSARPTRSAPPGSSSSSCGRSAPASQFVKGPPDADPGAVAYDAIAAGAPRRRRRRDHRHRRTPAHPGRPDGRAREGPPRDRQADPRRARTRRC